MTSSAGSQISPRQLLPVVALPIFLAISNQTMVAVALPAIGNDLGEILRLPWVIIGYVVAQTIAGPAYGVLGDSRGRKRMLMFALAIFLVGTLVCAVSSNIETLTAGRLIQGLGSGGLMSMSQSLIGQLLSPRDRGKAYGYVSTISIVASSLGPALAGLIVEFLGWQAVFLATVPLVLFAAVLLRRIDLPSDAPTGRRFDATGFAVLVLFVCLSTATIEVVKSPDSLVLAAVLAAGAASTLAVLVATQRRSENPLFPPVLFARPAARIASVLVFCHGAILVSLVTLVPLHLSVVRDADTLLVSISMLALTISFGLAGLLAGNLMSLTGRVSIIPSVILPLGAVSVVAIAFFGARLEVQWLVGLYMLTGLSIGSNMAVVHTTLQQISPSDLRGRAAGAVTFFRSVGAALGTALITLILFTLAPLDPGSSTAAIGGAGTITGGADREAWEIAYRGAYLAIGGFIAVGWFMALINPVRRIA